MDWLLEHPQTQRSLKAVGVVALSVTKVSKQFASCRDASALQADLILFLLVIAEGTCSLCRWCEMSPL